MINDVLLLGERYDVWWKENYLGIARWENEFLLTYVDNEGELIKEVIKADNWQLIDK